MVVFSEINKERIHIVVLFTKFYHVSIGTKFQSTHPYRVRQLQEKTTLIILYSIADFYLMRKISVFIEIYSHLLPFLMREPPRDFMFT